MDYFWYLLGYTTDTPITTTTFKNKDIMNAINKELIIFDKKKLKKATIKKPTKRKKRVPVSEKVKTGKAWVYPFKADESTASLVLRESVLRDNCNYSKIMNERIQQAYAQNPLPKK